MNYTLVNNYYNFFTCEVNGQGEGKGMQKKLQKISNI